MSNIDSYCQVVIKPIEEKIKELHRKYYSNNIFSKIFYKKKIYEYEKLYLEKILELEKMLENEFIDTN